jgi:hypothetical protein
LITKKQISSCKTPAILVMQVNTLPMSTNLSIKHSNRGYSKKQTKIKHTLNT